jgi:hypothetical protein
MLLHAQYSEPTCPEACAAAQNDVICSENGLAVCFLAPHDKLLLKTADVFCLHYSRVTPSCRHVRQVNSRLHDVDTAVSQVKKTNQQKHNHKQSVTQLLAIRRQPDD